MSRTSRLVGLLATAALLAVVGPATTLAQAPAAPASTPKARVKGVVPATPPPAPAPVPSMPNPDDGPPGIPPSLGQPPAMGLPAGGLSPTPGSDEPAPRRDDRVVPAEADDKNPLPPSIQPAGGSPTPIGEPGSGSGPSPFALPIDHLGSGKQRVQVTVEVLASPIINLGKESTVKLVVKNEGNVDASSISLVYQLPDGLKMTSSTPEATPVPGDKALYHWSKPMIATGGEWTVVLKVIATASRACEHAATVTAKTGSRANTIVQEPKLKVEATVSPGRVLKGEQVNFQIIVRNPGTGPARNVTVQAKLSSGLKLGPDDLVEQSISEIGPGQYVELDPLWVDSVGGGEQTCTIDVRSPDVNTVVEEQRITRKVEVTKPDLLVKLEGQTERYTGQTNEYKLVVSNPGTAPAKKVKVSASLPQQGGKLVALPPKAKFLPDTRKLLWSIDQLEPGQTVEMTFVYGTSTPGLYRATAEVTSGELRSTDTMTTEVAGIAVLDLQVTQTNKLMDVGKTNYYDITIKNMGTKEATKLLLSGKLTPNLVVLKHFNVDKGDFVFNQAGPEKGQFLFPAIERLAVGQTITLSLEVQATESGPAGCHVFLAHAEMGTEEGKVEDVVSTTITGNGKPRAIKP